jgi:hypothetical protein
MSAPRTALLLLLAWLSTTAIAQPYQYGCPHSGARGLGAFKQTTKQHAQFKSVAERPGWAVAMIGSGEIPGLKDDGVHIDPLRTHTAHYTVYESSTHSDKTFWMREYNVGEIVATGRNLVSEGVGDYHSIIADAREKKFVLANIVTDKVRTEDVIWTNTIFTSTAGGPHTNDLTRFMSINEKFLESLPPDQAATMGSKTLFVTTARAPNGEELLTFFTRTKEGHWRGFARSVTHYKGVTAELQWHLGRISGGRLYVYGDHLPSVDFNALADAAGVDTVRRAPEVAKNFVETHRRLNRLSERRMSKEKTTLVNGLPSTREELASAGLPAGGVNEWRAFRDVVEQRVAGRYGQRIAGKTAFIQELRSGTSDMILIVAHSDGPAIYIGRDRITLEELQRLPKRNNAGTRARLALLLSCDTGKLTPQQVGVFRTKMSTLATILVEKNFVDEVVAPDHTIKRDETIAVLEGLLNGSSAAEVRRQYPGWQKLAVLRKRDWFA